MGKYLVVPNLSENNHPSLFHFDVLSIFVLLYFLYFPSFNALFCSLLIYSTSSFLQIANTVVSGHAHPAHICAISAIPAILIHLPTERALLYFLIIDSTDLCTRA